MDIINIDVRSKKAGLNKIKNTNYLIFLTQTYNASKSIIIPLWKASKDRRSHRKGNKKIDNVNF